MLCATCLEILEMMRFEETLVCRKTFVKVTAGVGIRCVEHICTEVAPWSVLLKSSAFSLQVCISKT